MTRLQYPKEIEPDTASLWLRLQTITIDGIGEENTYYADQFDNRFFCKNYPRPNVGVDEVKDS